MLSGFSGSLVGFLIGLTSGLPDVQEFRLIAKLTVKRGAPLEADGIDARGARARGQTMLRDTKAA